MATVFKHIERMLPVLSGAVGLGSPSCSVLKPAERTELGATGTTGTGSPEISTEPAGNELLLAEGSLHFT